MSLHPTRRQAIAGMAALPFSARAGAAPPSETWLLIDKHEIDAARVRADKFPWAKASLDEILATARQALAAKIELPDRGGQWPHWYSCKRDGVRLQTVSPTEHRCPQCGTVYRGEPYDSVVIERIHSRYSRSVQSLGLAFRFTGDATYARRAAGILTAYAARYASYPLHNVNGEPKVGGGRISSQTLDESVWLIPMAWGYALVRETMDQPARERVEKDLFVAAAEVIREHRMKIHNIQCWKNSAVGLAGFVSGRQDLVAHAIDDSDYGFRAQVAKGITDDGLWYEGSLGYHEYTMNALWPLAEAARHAGIDLYSDRFRTLWDAPLKLALPNGDSPGFNDGGGSNAVNLFALYELAYARGQRPEYGRLAAGSTRHSVQSLLYGAETVPTGPAIPEESSLLRAAGFAVLRAAGPTVAAMRFGLHGGGHGHPDKLGLVTWGAGRMWGLDPGSIDYGVPLFREWYRTTIAHNTVTVDGGQQANADGALRDWRVVKDSTSIVASADAAFPNINLTRTVTARAGKLTDRFDCISTAEHTWDWAFHAAGTFTTSLDLKPGPERLGDAHGYPHIESLRTARTEGEWWARWEAEGASCTLRVKAAAGTEVFAGVAPGKNPASRVPLVIVRRRGKSTAFDVVHEFAKA